MDSYRFGFVMEQTLGHVTYHRRLAHLVAEDPAVRADLAGHPALGGRPLGPDARGRSQSLVVAQPVRRIA